MTAESNKILTKSETEKKYPSSLAIYREYKERILADPKKSRELAYEINDYLHQSTVCYHGRCVFTLPIPKIYPPETVRFLADIVDTSYRIFDKIINAYLKDPEYRKQFGFSKDLEELIITERGYRTSLPIARFDIFFNEETFDFKFCEINTDGTSAMNEDFVLNQAFDLMPIHKELKEKYHLQSWELYDSWVKSFMEIYSSYPKKKEKPYVAIVDFLETGSVTEFEEFQRRFEKAGYECEVAEIAELKYRDGILYSPTGHPIDVIYRRAVTRDVMENAALLSDFINAVKGGAVCLIGSFATQIIHNKILFKLIWEEPTLNLLTDSEKAFVLEHFPFTARLGDGLDKKQILENKDKWLVKPVDSYASMGVFAGCDQTEKRWAEIIDKAWNTDYIVQEYCTPYTTENICYIENDDKFKPYTNMSGLFVYGGKFAGVYSRLSDGGIISSQYNEKSVPSYFMESF